MFIIGLFQLDAPASDPQADALLLRFNDVAQKANLIQSEQGLQAAIDFFKAALDDSRNDNFGQFICASDSFTKRRDEMHFRPITLRCHQDRRVAVWTATLLGWIWDVTATLTVTDLPAGGEVIVIEPKEFEDLKRSTATARSVSFGSDGAYRARRSELALSPSVGGHSSVCLSVTSR